MLFDICHELHEKISFWPGSHPFKKVKIREHKTDGHQDTSILLNLHHGTHVDFPRHFINTGKTGVDFPPDYLCGRALVVEKKGKKLNIEKIKQLIVRHQVEHLLIKTKNSKSAPSSSFKKNFIALELEEAKRISQIKLKSIGIDGPSIQSFDFPNFSPHLFFLKRNILIIENLNLKKVPPSLYQMTGAWIKIKASDASPVRLFLKREIEK